MQDAIHTRICNMPEVLIRVFENMQRCVNLCRDGEGRHLQQLLQVLQKTVFVQIVINK
jgi:hypothetical protein